MNISAQDLRNIYEKLYGKIREYLWPYDTLEVLAEIETNIYSAFVDIPKLRTDCSKLYSSIKDICTDDPDVADLYNKLVKLVNNDDIQIYVRLPKVNEVRPDKPKQFVLRK